MFVSQPEEQSLGERVQVGSLSSVSALGTKPLLTSLSVILGRYGGFSLGARSTQVLPPANEIDDAIDRLRKIFEISEVSKDLGQPNRRQIIRVDRIFEPFQGAAADRFLDSLSGFINGLDTKNNVKV